MAINTRSNCLNLNKRSLNTKPFTRTLISLVLVCFILEDQCMLLNAFAPDMSKGNEVRINKVTTSLYFSMSDTSAESEGNRDDETCFFSPNPVSNDTEIKNNYNTNDDLINEYSFFDEAVIYVRAGSGGQGMGSYKKGNKGQNTIPDGGSGGRGGDVILVSDSSLNTLAGLTNAWRPNSFGGGGAARQNASYRFQSFAAENGLDGGRGYANGKYGKDCVIRVPPGTFVQEEYDMSELDEETGKMKVIDTILRDIGYVDSGIAPQLIVAVGGEGGEGTGAVGKGRGVKRPRTGPVGGEKKRLKLTLKVVADVALVAVPNAGKSTTLASVTRAKPKISNYPFTTLIPNLGVWVPEASLFGDERSRTRGAGSKGLILCDIPGLVSGAAEVGTQTFSSINVSYVSN